MSERIYRFEFSESECQLIIHAVTGYYKSVAAAGGQVNPSQTIKILSAFEKMKKAIIGVGPSPTVSSLAEEFNGESTCLNPPLKS